ncbi:MAG: ornithine cyclodeaminase family protein [Alphaproteobacteria bacterium]|nr:ornithine cyclodeaminase family protein [Alphaproteobacteria bacterium]
MPEPSLLYLSEADVARVALPPDSAREAVAATFAAHHATRAGVKPKLSLEIAPGHSFQSMCAASAEAGVAINKWLGIAPLVAGSTGASIHAMVALNDYRSGRLLAVMDGNLLTAIRTAAMSALAARHLASPSPETIAFIGCGLQAHSHLAALHALYPGLRRVRAISRTPRSADALVSAAAARGLQAAASSDPAAVIAESDLVVTTVPMHAGFRPFLDPAWLRPGSFAAAVDVGRSWMAPGLAALDIRATDDRSQAGELAKALGLGDPAPFHADLAELASGAVRGRTDPRQRAMFVFRGFALGDLAVAARIYESARSAGIGTVLAR